MITVLRLESAEPDTIYETDKTKHLKQRQFRTNDSPLVIVILVIAFPPKVPKSVPIFLLKQTKPYLILILIFAGFP